MPDHVETLPEFDPAAVTEALIPSLSKDRLREVLIHYSVPEPAKSASLGDLQALALLALRAHAPAEALPPAAEPVAEAEVPGTALEPRAQSVVPSASRWQLIVTMAEYLSTSNLTPTALRGPGKVHDLGAVLLRANDLGIPLTAAMEQLYVVQGKVGMESKLMRALARRDGHHIWDDPKSNKYEAIVHGERADNGDRATATFTLDDALDFGLIKSWRRNDDDTITVEADMTAKPMWKKDTANMLKNRATARLCRDLFSDCLAGVSYTPDELGYIDVDPADEVKPYGRAGEDEPTMTLKQQQSEIARRIAELPEDIRIDMRENEWKRRRLPKPDDLSPATIRTALGIIEAAERKAQERHEAETAGIPDAEVVEDATSTGQERPPVDNGGQDQADEGPICTGCGEPITDPPVFDNDDAPWHAECATFL